MRTVDTYITDDGELQVLVNGELTFEEAAQISNAVFAQIGLRLPIRITQAPEQHRPDGPRHLHVHATHGS